MSTLDKWNVELNEMERKLRPPTIGLVPYEPKVIPLTTGEDMLVREARDEEIPAVLEAIKPLLDHEKDYYDIVAARIYAELLGKLRYRVQDEYLFWGLIDGELAGIVNGRIVNAKTGMSYHTMTLKRGARVGGRLAKPPADGRQGRVEKENLAGFGVGDLDQTGVGQRALGGV